jgi:hypothetical protein
VRRLIVRDVPLEMESFTMAKAGRKGKPKRRARVAGYCGAPTDGRPPEARYHDRCVVSEFARRRRLYWDFEEVRIFHTHGFTGPGPADLKQLKTNLLREHITDLICPAADWISCTATVTCPP